MTISHTSVAAPGRPKGVTGARDLPNRILDALREQSLTAAELSRLLDASESGVRSALAQLSKKRCISAAALAPSTYGAPPRLYRLADERRVMLGLLAPRHVPGMVERISSLLLEHGELALFVDAKRVAYAVLHHDPGYQDALSKQAKHMVGRYRCSEVVVCAVSQIGEDILFRLEELREERARAVA